MKKVLVAMTVAALAFVLAGCASGASGSSAASGDAASGSASAAASDASAASAEAASSEAASSEAANPSEDAKDVEGDQGQATEWASAESAAEAAQGAGFALFGVPDGFTFGDLEFGKPTFSFADGVAQATYETPATMVTIRKGDGVYGAPLTDRDYAEFPQKWTQNHKGLEIECYGAKEGAATVIQWNIDSAAYAVTYQGLGGEEMTMTPDEIASIVSGIQ